MPGYIKTKDDEIIAWTEKAASRTLLAAIPQRRAASADELRARQTPVTLYLRHPVERLVSAWAYFTGLGWSDLRDLRGCTYEAFVDKVLDKDLSNRHWSPQIAQHAGINIAEIRRVEDMALDPRFKNYRVNPSTHPKPDPQTAGYRVADMIAGLYSEDWDAWVAAKRL